MILRDGLLLVRKPPHVTSFRALDAVKRRVAPAKVGHTGTLDSFAAGLLVVLCGRMTKLAPLVSRLDKEYVAVFRFGIETDTLDPEGEVVRRGEVPPTRIIEEMVPRFVGAISQTPPAYSAVHVGGTRAYELARAGKAPDMSARTVTIHSIEIESYLPPDLKLRVACSKGTYIRSLARDLGRACGSCAYVSELLRTRVGGFSLEHAVGPEDFEPDRDLYDWQETLPRLGVEMRCRLRVGWDSPVASGATLRNAALVEVPPRNGLVAVYGSDGSFRALVSHENGAFKYEIVAGGPGR